MENQTMTQKNPLNHQHIFPVLLKVLSFVTKKNLSSNSKYFKMG